MQGFQFSRLIVSTLLLFVLAGNARQGANTERLGTLCPSRECKCRRKDTGIKVSCHKASGVIPEFEARNVTYSIVSLVKRNITAIPSGAFQNACARAVDLAGNWLNEGGIADDAFTGLETQVELVGLSKCGLSDIPTKSLSGLSTLQILRLDGNSITVVGKKSFVNNIRLEELFLYRNKITILQKRAFAGLGNLRNLKLFENQLEEVPKHAFRGLANLTSLDLSRNHIVRLHPRTFKGLKQLKWLEVASNFVFSLSQSTFRGLPRLKYLRLDNNPLVTIEEGSLGGAKHLAYLSLDIGNVSNLRQPIFGGLRRLLTLNLGEINRDSLPAGLFQDMDKLVHLSLSDEAAKLRDLSPDVFSNRTNFRKLKIWKAPLTDCRCTERWISKLTRKGAYIHGYCAHKQPVSCFRRGKTSGGQTRSRWFQFRQRKPTWGKPSV